MKAYFQQKYQQWLDRRLPTEHALELNQKRLFIFPTRQGFFFLMLIIGLIIAGINFQNNLAYLLSFFLLSLLVSSILLTFFNVSGLCLTAAGAAPVFAGDNAQLNLLMSTHGKSRHHQIHLGYFPLQTTDVDSSEPEAVKLFCQTYQRGWFQPPRFRLYSVFPFGFIQCWSWVQLDWQVMVYPKPKYLNSFPTTAVEGDRDGDSQRSGNDDFYGFKEYQPGDSLKQVNWRGFARGGHLMTRVMHDQRDARAWVDWYALPAVGTEEKLSLLCGWVLTLDRSDTPYGLRLPGLTIQPNSGERHRNELLKALALFQSADLTQPEGETNG
ncbi:Uncharacterised protein [BD1-7 clade bacterium]|uniref:Uncharacterized protein n=1 Tax=BD1-7 clade bacterium TaxID=2029982 RepID=A0A5S9PS22_9GAMM|nr:Uncharacterised protein [BD1-7 clade bacterium]